MKSLRHGQGIPCKQKHIVTVTKVRDITCPLCRNMLQADPSLIESLKLEPIFIPAVSKDQLIEKIEAIPAPCEKCGSHMVKKQSKRAFFWGCGNFPRCRNTRNY